MSPDSKPAIRSEWKSTVPQAPSPIAPPVPSPCVSLCQMDPETGLCHGCLRTIDEIVNWSGADDDFKRAVWLEIKRREALQK